MSEVEVKKCPKRVGKMVKGLDENLNGYQSYYCGNCGYIEFYRKTKEEEV